MVRPSNTFEPQFTFFEISVKFAMNLIKWLFKINSWWGRKLDQYPFLDSARMFASVLFSFARIDMGYSSTTSMRTPDELPPN